MKIRGLIPEEVKAQGLTNTEVWYVVNVTEGIAVALPEQTEEFPETRDAGDPYERVCPVFVEKEHAKTVEHLVGKNAYAGNDKLDVENNIYQNILERTKDYPEFNVQFYSSELGEEFLAQYEADLRTRELEEQRKKELEGKTIDELYELDDD